MWRKTVCPECDRIVSRTFGHGASCSMPTRGDAPPQLPEQVPAVNPWGSVPNLVEGK
jgi:hypothetical protein